MGEIKENNFIYEDPVHRSISLGNFGAKIDKFLSQMQNIIRTTDNMETKKINQISSLLDQMTKLMNDVMEEK